MISNKTKIEPDNIESPYGILSPSGEWFSCQYGEHEGLAACIVTNYFNRFDFSDAEEYRYFPENNMKKIEVESNRDASLWTGFYDSLTFLIQRYNYIAVGSMYGRLDACWNITRSNNHLRKITSRQRDVLYKLEEKHHVDVDWSAIEN